MEVLKLDRWKCVQPNRSREKDLLKALTLPNPVYLSTKKYATPWALQGMPSALNFWAREGDDTFWVPRGFRLFDEEDDFLETQDLTTDSPITFPVSSITLSPVQKSLKDQCLRQVKDMPHVALLVAETGEGKTVLGLSIAEALHQKTLVLVHTGEILRQWVTDCERHWGFTPGIIKQKEQDLSQPLTVAMVQTWINRPELHDSSFGFVIADECHRTPTSMFTEALTCLSARYQIGLSATPDRKDCLTPVVYAYFGKPIISKEKSTNAVPLDRAYIIGIPYTGNYKADGSFNINEFISSYVDDEARWKLIAKEIKQEWDLGHSCLVVVSTIHKYKRIKGERKKVGPGEIFQLEKYLRVLGINPGVLIASKSKSERSTLIHQAKSGHNRVLLATKQIIAEGTNIPRLDRLFICSPMGKGLEQLAGRIRRSHPVKQDTRVVYFRDHDNGPANFMAYNKAAPAFEGLGAKIIHTERGFHEQT